MDEGKMKKKKKKRLTNPDRILRKSKEMFNICGKVESEKGEEMFHDVVIVAAGGEEIFAHQV